MSIYHLHIPRTSGIYIKQNVLPHLISSGVDHFSSNRTIVDIDQIKKSKYVAGHFGTAPIKLMNEPKVFSIVRNPVERFISYFNYTTGLIRTKSEAHQKLDNWLYGPQSEVQSNLQSKFLTGEMNFNKFNEGVNLFQLAVWEGWYIENYSLDLNIIKNNIDKFFCYTLEDHDMFKEDFNKALKEEFGFTTFKYADKANRSSNLGIEITKKQMNRIEELNSIDMEVYEYVQKNKKRY
jgi:hypothetical protein